MQTVYQEFKQKLSYILEHPTVRALIILFLITITAAVLVEIFESHHNNQFQNIWDSVWWVLVTITTVGYGDKIPVTPAGKILGILVMLVGIAALSVVTATLSSVLVTRKIREGKGLQELKLKDHILLCGWNEQAQEILSTFEQEGHTKDTIVLINQLAEEIVTDILARYPLLKLQFVRGDFTREGILNRANAQNAKAAIIVPDESALSGKSGDERTILATLSLKTLNSNIKVYAHINDRDNLPHLKKARADEVLVKDAYSGYLLANYVSSPGVPQFIMHMFDADSDYTLQRRPIPAELVGQTFADLKEFYQNKYEGILLGLGTMTEPFSLGDLMSDESSSYLDEFIMRKFQEAGRGMDGNEQVQIHINPKADTRLQKNDFYLSIESKDNEDSK